MHWRAVRLLPLGKLNSPFLLYNDLQQCVCERVCVFHLLFLGGFKWLCVFIPAKRIKRDRKSSVIKFQLQLQVFISHFEQTLSLTNAHTHPEPSKTHLFQWLQGHQKVSELKNLPEVNCSPFEADTAGNHTHTLVKKAFNQKETQVLRCAPSSPRLAVRNVMTCEDKRPRRCFTLTHRDTE